MLRVRLAKEANIIDGGAGVGHDNYCGTAELRVVTGSTILRLGMYGKRAASIQYRMTRVMI